MKKEVVIIVNTYYHLYISLFCLINKGNICLIVTRDTFSDDKIVFIVERIKQSFPQVSIQCISRYCIPPPKSFTGILNHFNWYIRKHCEPAAKIIECLVPKPQVYLFNETEYFSYFILNHFKSAILIEEGNGIYLHRSFIAPKNICRRIIFEILTSLNITPIWGGRSVFIKQIWCKSPSRLPWDIRRKGKEYDPNNIIAQIDKANRERVLSVFDIDLKWTVTLSSSIHKKMIFITGPYLTIGFTEEYIISLMKTMIAENIHNINDFQLIIKPHPRDTVIYLEHFPDAIIISKDLPIEFLNIIGFEPDIALTICSSAMENIKAKKKVVYSKNIEELAYKTKIANPLYR